MAQIFRRSKLRALEAGLGAHIDGRSRPVGALPREGLEPVVLLGDDGAVLSAELQQRRHAAAKAHLARCRARPARGRPAAPVVCFFVGGLPRYGDRPAWRPWIPDAEELPVLELHRRQGAVALNYGAAAVRWIVAAAGPDSRVAHAALHQDAAFPHVELMLVVADARGRLGWNKVAAGFAGADAPPVGDRRFMAAVQDEFQRRVASRFGIDRGTPIARRTAIDHQIDAAERAADERREADQVLADLRVRAELAAEVERLARERDRLAAEVERLGAERQQLAERLKPYEALGPADVLAERLTVTAGLLHDHSAERLRELLVDRIDNGSAVKYQKLCDSAAAKVRRLEDDQASLATKLDTAESDRDRLAADVERLGAERQQLAERLAERNEQLKPYIAIGAAEDIGAVITEYEEYRKLGSPEDLHKQYLLIGRLRDALARKHRTM